MKLTKKQEKFRELDKKKEINHRYNNRNWKAMTFCNKHGLTIYPLAQATTASMIKLFVKRGEDFLPLDGIMYDQTEPEDVVRYIAAIDAEYERLYLKMKDRV